MRWSEWKEREQIGGDISHTPTPTPTLCLEYSNFYWGNSWIFILDQDLFNMFASGKNPWFQSFFICKSLCCDGIPLRNVNKTWNKNNMVEGRRCFPNNMDPLSPLLFFKQQPLGGLWKSPASKNLCENHWFRWIEIFKYPGKNDKWRLCPAETLYMF